MSKVFIDPNTQQPRIYSGEIISYNGTKKNKQYRVRYYDDGDTEDIGVRELSEIVDEGGSGKVRSDGDDLATQQDSSDVDIDIDIDDNDIGGDEDDIYNPDNSDVDEDDTYNNTPRKSSKNGRADGSSKSGRG